MGAMTPVPADHPLMIAWEFYKQSDDYANTRRWAKHDEHLDGSLWAAFERGWALAMSSWAGAPPANLLPAVPAPPSAGMETPCQAQDQSKDGWCPECLRRFRCARPVGHEGPHRDIDRAEAGAGAAELLALKNVTRVEVIGDGGRLFTRWHLVSVQASMQDDGRTLKLFVSESNEGHAALAAPPQPPPSHVHDPEAHFTQIADLVHRREHEMSDALRACRDENEKP